MTRARVSELRRLLGQISGSSWHYDETTNAVTIDHGSSVVSMRVMHDSMPAPPADTRFIASCRADTLYLLDRYSSRAELDPALGVEIRARYLACSPGPWVPWLESDGGLGGCNVITMGGDNHPDLYLWIEDEPAPDPDWLFVATSHSAIPALLQLLEV